MGQDFCFTRLSHKKIEMKHQKNRNEILKKTEVNVPIQLVIDMQNDRTYYKRISDKVLDLKLIAFGATNIVGPKWCGKTETALQKAKSSLPDDCS